MAARRALVLAVRASPFSATTERVPLRAGGLLSAPKPSLPKVCATSPITALPLSSASGKGYPTLWAASRGGLPTPKSMGNVPFATNVPAGGLRNFSSSAGGGRVPPAWLEGINNETPAKMFTDLDIHGRQIVRLYYCLLEHEGGHLDVNLQVLEKALGQQIVTASEKFKEGMKYNESIIVSVMRLGLMSAVAGSCVYLYWVGDEFVGRVFEALGQMRIHADDIRRDFLKASIDDQKPTYWPFRKFQVVFKDEWWQDPKKQAEREAAAAAASAAKAKAKAKASKSQTL